MFGTKNVASWCSKRTINKYLWKRLCMGVYKWIKLNKNKWYSFKKLAIKNVTSCLVSDDMSIPSSCGVSIANCGAAGRNDTLLLLQGSVSIFKSRKVKRPIWLGKKNLWFVISISMIYNSSIQLIKSVEVTF